MRYGYFQVFDSYINYVYSGWKADFTRLTTNEELTNLGSVALYSPPVASLGRDAGDVTRMYGCVAGCGMLLAHGNLEFTNIDLGDNGGYGIIFFGAGDLTARNLFVLNSAAVTDIYGFIARGVKTFVDCSLDETNIDGFWSDYSTVHKYTLSASAETPDGNAIENVRMRMWNIDDDILTDSPEFDITSHASGVFADQEVTYCTSGMPGYDNLQPMTFFVNRAGLKEKLFNYTFSQEADFVFGMANVREDFS